jgi:pimeloyl-ACP methyl ester carboxylesterase
MGEISSLKKRKKSPGMAGAYKHSKVIGLRWNLSTILMIIFTVSLFIFIFDRWLGVYLKLLLFSLMSITIFLMCFDNYIISKILTAPDTTGNLELSNVNWKHFQYMGWGGDILPAHFLEAKVKSDTLIFFLHGWSSSPGNIESRMLHAHEHGVHVLTTDLRGHKLSVDLKHDWTFLKMLADVEYLLEHFEKEVHRLGIKNLIFYGHSMGGFLSLRLSSHSSGWWGEKLTSVVLESPMVSFPMIMNLRHPGILRLLLPLTRQILRREYLRIHPDLSLKYIDSEIPRWGIPELPLLVLQSSDDIRLGSRHYELISKHLPKDSTAHIIKSLEHTSRFDSNDRRALFSEFLYSKYNLVRNQKSYTGEEK